MRRRPVPPDATAMLRSRSAPVSSWLNSVNSSPKRGRTIVAEPPVILVVDDVPDNVEIVRVRLESEGYSVIDAGDGEEALARVKAALPDLILLDIMMPK